jgi:hypothetical protein
MTLDWPTQGADIPVKIGALRRPSGRNRRRLDARLLHPPHGRARGDALGPVTYEMMESYWPAVARGDAEAPLAMRD